jgi:hypothetical protein
MGFYRPTINAFSSIARPVPNRENIVINEFPIKVNKGLVKSELDVLHGMMPKPIQKEEADVQGLSTLLPHCYYPTMEKQLLVPGKTCKAAKMNIRHSVYKLTVFANAIRGKHLYDA